MSTPDSLRDHDADGGSFPGRMKPRVPILALKNVGVFYQRRGKEPNWALQDISLNLFKGETLGVIGRNGAGKSTLLRLLAGIIRPDTGDYVNHGYQATLLSLQVGFVGYLSGRENIILSGLLLGIDLSQIKERIDGIIEFSGLGESIDDPIDTYSSGMKARLGFSAAFYVDPDILLVDEVLGVGDAEFVEKSTAVMKERIRSDKTVVLVSHNPNVVRVLCDRAVWIERGKTVAEGPTEEVMEAYRMSQEGSSKREPL